MRGRKTLAEFEQDLRSMVHFPDNVIIHYEINKASAVDTACMHGYVNMPTTRKQRTTTLSLTSVPISLASRAAAVGFLGLSLPFAFPKGLFVPPPPTTTTRLSHIRAQQKEEEWDLCFLPIIQKSEVSVWKAEDNGGGGEKRRKMPTKKLRDNFRPRRTTKLSKLIGFFFAPQKSNPNVTILHIVLVFFYFWSPFLSDPSLPFPLSSFLLSLPPLSPDLSEANFILG